MFVDFWIHTIALRGPFSRQGVCLRFNPPPYPPPPRPKCLKMDRWYSFPSKSTRHYAQKHRFIFYANRVGRNAVSRWRSTTIDLSVLQPTLSAVQTVLCAKRHLYDYLISPPPRLCSQSKRGLQWATPASQHHFSSLWHQSQCNQATAIVEAWSVGLWLILFISHIFPDKWGSICKEDLSSSSLPLFRGERCFARAVIAQKSLEMDEAGEGTTSCLSWNREASAFTLSPFSQSIGLSFPD